METNRQVNTNFHRRGPYMPSGSHKMLRIKVGDHAYIEIRNCRSTPCAGGSPAPRTCHMLVGSNFDVHYTWQRRKDAVCALTPDPGPSESENGICKYANHYRLYLSDTLSECQHPTCPVPLGNTKDTSNHMPTPRILRQVFVRTASTERQRQERTKIQISFSKTHSTTLWYHVNYTFSTQTFPISDTCKS